MFCREKFKCGCSGGTGRGKWLELSLLKFGPPWESSKAEEKKMGAGPWLEHFRDHVLYPCIYQRDFTICLTCQGINDARNEENIRTLNH